MPDQTSYRLRVNGTEHDVSGSPATTLLSVLRDDLRLTGTKYNCEQGECGACTVLLDGRPVNSCLVLGVTAAGSDVVTVEGVGADGLNPMQQAFVDCDAAQCGYCTPGMVVAATALLERNACPSRGDIDEALAGNYCRCTGYESIVTAIRQCAVSDA
jgi:aerobic carbon-monoxide dehydrogenase small subunit